MQTWGKGEHSGADERSWVGRSTISFQVHERALGCTRLVTFPDPDCHVLGAAILVSTFHLLLTLHLRVTDLDSGRGTAARGPRGLTGGGGGGSWESGCVHSAPRSL